MPLQRISPPPLAPQVEVLDLTRPGIRVLGIADARLTQFGLKFRDSGPTQLVVDGKHLKGLVVGQDSSAGTMMDVGPVAFLQSETSMKQIPVGPGRRMRLPSSASSPRSRFPELRRSRRRRW